MTRKPAAPTCPQLVLDWIAWYPGGDLPADVRGAIEVHAAECAACRREIADLAGESVAGEPAAGAERVFARTLQRIEGVPRASAPPPRRRRIWLVRPRFAIAAAVAVAVVSGTIGVVATQQLRADATYETASLREPSAAAEAGARLDVVFSPEASYAEIEEAIHAIGASVESGPSASGVVQLRLTRGANLSAAAQRLESGDLDVAEYAQPAP